MGPPGPPGAPGQGAVDPQEVAQRVLSMLIGQLCCQQNRLCQCHNHNNEIVSLIPHVTYMSKYADLTSMHADDCMECAVQL